MAKNTKKHWAVDSYAIGFVNDDGDVEVDPAGETEVTEQAAIKRAKREVASGYRGAWPVGIVKIVRVFKVEERKHVLLTDWVEPDEDHE